MDGKSIYESHGDSSEDLHRSSKVDLQKEDTRSKNMGFYSQSMSGIRMRNNLV